MAESRLIGGYPVIGIRPTIDGRRGPLKVREGLEDQTMGMALRAKKLIEENVKYSNGPLRPSIVGLIPITGYPPINLLSAMIISPPYIIFLFLRPQASFCDFYYNVCSFKTKVLYYKKIVKYSLFYRKDLFLYEIYRLSGANSSR